jgi:predicted RNase H-like HicB family nuclease/transcriptional regulator with XRE-family HTH domain
MGPPLQATPVPVRHKFRAVFEPNPNGWWTVTLPEVDGCISEGKSLSEARKQIRGALAVCGDVVPDAESVAEDAELDEDIRLPVRAGAAVRKALAAREKADNVELAARRATKAAIELLTALGLSRRDVGELLGMSGQRVQQLVGSRNHAPQLAAVTDGEWARPRVEPAGEALAALAAVLKTMPAPLPVHHVRLAATLVLEPRWLLPALDADESHQWSRVIGADAKPLPAGVTLFVPVADRAWGSAVKTLRGSGFLLEDRSAGTWAPGQRLAEISTRGWPEGRAAFVMHVLQRGSGAELLASLPEPIRRSIDAKAA